MTAESLEIVGVCRFSYLGLSDWRAQHGGGVKRSRKEVLDLVRSTLFLPERMARRFATFEKLTLPSLAAQTDKNFRLIVLTAEELPQEYADRLRSLAEQYPFLHLEFAAPGRAPVVMNGIYAKMGLQLEELLQFRLDDDDALGATYIARLRELAAVMRASQPDRAFAITFPTVLIATVVDDQLHFRRRHFPHTAAGQGMYHQKRNVLDWAHHRVDRALLSVSDNVAPWVLQTFLTGVNDSGPLSAVEMRRRGMAPIEPELVAEVLATHFPSIPADPDQWRPIIHPEI